MTCTFVEDHLSDYLELLLSPEEHDQVQQHLAGCAGCRPLAELVQEVIVTLGEFPTHEPLPSLEGKILERTSWKKTPWSQLWEWAAVGLQVVRSPRFGLSTALILFSVALGADLLGPSFHGMTASDLQPQNLYKNARIVSRKVVSRSLQLYDKTEDLKADLNYLAMTLYYRVGYRLDQVTDQITPEREKGGDGKQTQGGNQSALPELSA
ncbi:MAG: zf-HC2 domain-containing protein [Acidobacteria bacterium]|nr:zf-HC2 domain-containing protein [Acidobacteriota bacterium]